MVDPLPHRVRVLIGDDHTLFRKGIAELLASDGRFEIVGEAVDGEQTLTLAKSLRPEVVIVDLKMPKLSGVQVAKELTHDLPSAKVLILTGFEADTYVLEALAAGAAGYILKDTEPESLISSVLAVLGNEYVISSKMARRVLQSLSDSSILKESYDGLTPRELEILRLAATGLANKEIARRLHVSEKTVRNHVANIYDKLGIHDRSQALLYAVRKGLVDPV